MDSLPPCSCAEHRTAGEVCGCCGGVSALVQQRYASFENYLQRHNPIGYYHNIPITANNTHLLSIFIHDFMHQAQYVQPLIFEVVGMQYPAGNTELVDSMECTVLNERCPWSNRPVARDSLTLYTPIYYSESPSHNQDSGQGVNGCWITTAFEHSAYAVAFCNPDCRDEFDSWRTNLCKNVHSVVKSDVGIKYLQAIELFNKLYTNSV